MQKLQYHEPTINESAVELRCTYRTLDVMFISGQKCQRTVRVTSNYNSIQESFHIPPP